MPVLTVVDADPRHPGARTELGDVCRLHARICAVADGLHTPAERLLWAHLPGGRIAIRTSRPIPADRWPPGWHTAIRETAWTPPPAGQARAVVVVNPVRRSSRTGRIVATPVPDRDIHGWLTGRLADHGIHTRHINVAEIRTVDGWRQGRRVTHRLATCTITADVVDADAAAELALHGVGRARAYGAGLTTWWAA